MAKGARPWQMLMKAYNRPTAGPKPSCSTSLKRDRGPVLSKRSSRPAQQPEVPPTCSGNSNFPTKTRSHWKHGGLVGVLGYGGGVIGRYSDVGEQVPESRALSHHAGESARGMVLYQRGSAHHLRYLGAARLGPDQHARLNRRHYSSRHHYRSTGTDLPGAYPRRIRSGRLGLGGAHAFLLRGHGALRVGLLRRHEALLRPDHGTTRTSCTVRLSPTSSSSSSPPVPTTASPPLPAPICR